MNKYKPNYCSPPCKTLEDWMMENNVKFSKVYDATSYSTQEVLDILHNKKRLNKVDCANLARLTGTSIKFWENRENKYLECLEYNRIKYLNSFGLVSLNTIIVILCLIWVLLSY